MRIAVVGGGFGGVGAVAMLARAGYTDVTVFERAERLGGVWEANTYPGAACDIPSHLYEFSFAPNPGWSRRYAPQAEIQAYLERVAQGHDVRLGVAVTGARFEDGRWAIETSAGPDSADVLITACGQLKTPRIPPLPGLDAFAGPAFHTARWRHDVDLAGQRVAVVGTGCSAIQVVPAIQPVAGRVDVYQRSPGWTLPKGDFAYPPRARQAFARYPFLQRIDRAATFAFHDFAAYAMTQRLALLKPFGAVGALQIKRAISDPELRRKVTPRDAYGCKRIMLTDDWYPTLAKPNVELIDAGVEAVTSQGIRAGGIERPADVIVFATGFESHEFVAPMEITGPGGQTLAQAWGERPRAYLGITVPGFPNLFLIYGPNTNGGSGSVIATIEAAMNHTIAALRTGPRRVEVRPEAAEAFDRELRGALKKTIWHTGCTNWYVDANGNDPNQWPWSWSAYRRRTARLDPAAYEISPEPRAMSGVGSTTRRDGPA